MHHLLRASLAATAVAVSCAVASAETYWANYSPSLATPNAFDDLWPGYHTPLDAAAENSLGSGAKYTGWTQPNPFAAFQDWDIATEFTPDSSFVASHITFATLYSYGNDSFFGVGVSKWDSDANVWVGLGSTRIRPRGYSGYSPNYIDLTVPFGNNVTGGSGGFTLIPISFEAGELYQVYFNGRGAGSAGGYTVRDSLVDGPSTNTWSDYAPNDLTYQPAFAFSDGTITAIPEPTSVALLSIAGTVMLASRRR